MGLFDGFRKPIVGLKEAGIGLISRGSVIDEDAEGEPQNISLQEKYDNAYLNFPIVAAAIDTTAEQVVQEFWFDGPNSDKLKEWADKINLGHKLSVIVKHMMMNGNLWVEMPTVKEMKFIDPKTMNVWRKTNGDVIGYTQDIEWKKIALWGSTGKKELNEGYKKKANIKTMVHFKYNVLAGDKYGTSLVHPVLPLLESKGSMESDLKIIYKRYAAPIIHAKVGDEMHLPNDADISNVKNQIKDIYADTEYATNYLTEFKVIGFEGKAMNLSEPLKHIDFNILTGMQFPVELTSLEFSSNKAEAEVKLRSWGRHIKAIQRILKIEFEDKIIIGQGLGSFKDKIIFGDAEEREQEIEVDQIRGLVTDGIITPQKANSLLPPEFKEELPEELANPAAAAFKAQQQDQKPFQKGGDKIKDNPTDPTKKQIEPGKRRNKTDREIPVK